MFDEKLKTEDKSYEFIVKKKDDGRKFRYHERKDEKTLCKNELQNVPTPHCVLKKKNFF